MTQVSPHHDSPHLDGNSLAGPLSDLFAVDVTQAWWRCPGCGSTGPLAELHVYGPEPGLTARCAHCSQVALRLVRHEEHTWLTLGGAEGAFRFRTAR
ncbi:DUF6510 family protein [Streptomyces nigra]|uniref:DUF6510 family protein n=1 Tax=Streptomyces nigra TaxID=1827580 RepID=UPI0034146F34